MGIVANKFLFPIPDPPSYRLHSFPGHLGFIPRPGGRNREGGYIPCLFIRQPGATRLLIYSHGNGCDIGLLFRELLVCSKSWNINIIAVELRGYGLNIGTPSEETINSDLRIVFDYAHYKLRQASSSIIFFGRSIGSGPTSKVVADLCEQVSLIISCRTLSHPLSLSLSICLVLSEVCVYL